MKVSYLAGGDKWWDQAQNAPSIVLASYAVEVHAKMFNSVEI